MLFQIFYGIVIKKEKIRNKKAGKIWILNVLILMIKQLTISARYYKDGSECLLYRGKNKNFRKLTPREVFYHSKVFQKALNFLFQIFKLISKLEMQFNKCC